MHHRIQARGTLAPHDVIASSGRDALPGAASAAFERRIMAAFDRSYGRGAWRLCWDEDLGGRPIRGTVRIAYGAEQALVIG